MRLRFQEDTVKESEEVEVDDTPFGQYFDQLDDQVTLYPVPPKKSNIIVIKIKLKKKKKSNEKENDQNHEQEKDLKKIKQAPPTGKGRHKDYPQSGQPIPDYIKNFNKNLDIVKNMARRYYNRNHLQQKALQLRFSQRHHKKSQQENPECFWPESMDEIYGEHYFSEFSEMCEDEKKCRNWGQILNEAYCGVQEKYQGQLTDEEAVFYIETRKDTLKQDDYAQLTFAVLPKHPGLVDPSKHAKYISACIPVNLKDQPIFETDCPFDSCLDRKSDPDGECKWPIEQEGKAPEGPNDIEADDLPQDDGEEEDSEPEEPEVSQEEPEVPKEEPEVSNQEPEEKKFDENQGTGVGRNKDLPPSEQKSNLTLL